MGLRSGGDITVWFSDEAREAWTPPNNGRRGGQRRYSNLAIVTTNINKAIITGSCFARHCSTLRSSLRFPPSSVRRAALHRFCGCFSVKILAKHFSQRSRGTLC